MILEQRAHENHLRLGVANPHCALCAKPVPEWVRRKDMGQLPAKDLTWQR